MTVLARSAPAARAENLVLAHGARTVLEAATFEIPARAITALIGPNGAGKSTLLHALAGLVTPRAGTLEVDVGAGAGAGVALVLQGTRVNEHLPLTVTETVRMGRYAHTGPFRRLSRSDRAAVQDAMERLGIAELATRPLNQLSGGQRQRAFVAQGLAQEAALLLLDEPITGLDLVSRGQIVEAIVAERAAGRTVVSSTHDLTDANAADHVILLAGRVVACGPPGEVLTDDHLTAAYGGHVIHVEGRTLLVDDHAHH